MASSSFALQVTNGSVPRHPVSPGFHRHKNSSGSFSLKPLFKELQQLPMKANVSQTIKDASFRMVDAFVDTMFRFVDQPLLPSQSNFAPVEEAVEATEVTCAEADLPNDFPEGIYVRNGPNPLFGGLKSTSSIFGRTNHVWAEGEGMLHALHLKKKENGDWTIAYNNKYIESETFKAETRLNRPSFLPAIEGDSTAILAAYFLNQLRFGTINKYLMSTSVFEHSGKLYAISENHIPQEIDISTLQSLKDWGINGNWDRPFTSHPKKVPGTGELVVMGIDAKPPYFVVGVVSAEGKLVHKADLKFEESILTHEIEISENYNVIIDHPVIIDEKRLINGGQLIKYCKEEKARIGVMPRYGDANSVKWFTVEPYCTWHIINTFEDGNEVVVRECTGSHIHHPGPDWGQDKYQWFSRGFKFTDNSEDGTNHDSAANGYLLHRVHEWRLNMETGQVKEKYLTGPDVCMDFPSINGDFTGLKHKFAFTQVIDSAASSIAGITKYGGLAKLHFDFEQCSSAPLMERECDQLIKTEYHKFPENVFCTGSTFVPKHGGAEEDDGWIITFVHNEESNVSQAYIIDAKNFEGEPIAAITLAHRVPYGNHGVFVAMPRQV